MTILKIRKSRLKDIQEPAQGSLAKNWWQQDAKPSLSPQPKLLNPWLDLYNPRETSDHSEAMAIHYLQSVATS